MQPLSHQPGFHCAVCGSEGYVYVFVERPDGTRRTTSLFQCCGCSATFTDPAKFTPEMFNVSFTGATGTVAFDAKGDRKDAEMTIFKLQGGKVVPVAIVKGGVSTPFAPAAPAAPAGQEASKGDAKPAEAKKEEPKKDEKKK